jgi:sugar phosphate isomerase/epimerase
VFPREVDLDRRIPSRAGSPRSTAPVPSCARRACNSSTTTTATSLRKLGGRTILERIFDETDPRNLGAELDTYWLQAGGGDPVAWIRRVAGRIPALHIKDLGVGPDNKPTFYEIGQGNLDFPAIVKAAEAGGCKWFVVEQDSSAGDPFDALAMSFDYIKSRLTQGVEMRG